MKNLICSITLVALFGAALTSAFAGGDRTKLEARMNSGEAAEAKGKFEARDGRMRLSVEVQGTANAVPGGVVRIEIGPFSALVSFDPVANNFDLNLDTTDGDSVPPVAAGDSVLVYDAATGALLLSGTFTVR